MAALSVTLLIFHFQFGMLIFRIGRQAAPALQHIGFHTQYRTLPKIWVVLVLNA